MHTQKLLKKVIMNDLNNYYGFNSIQDGFLQDSSSMGGKKAPPHKTCHTYHTRVKLNTVISYLKKI